MSLNISKSSVNDAGLALGVLVDRPSLRVRTSLLRKAHHFYTNRRNITTEGSLYFIIAIAVPVNLMQSQPIPSWQKIRPNCAQVDLRSRLSELKYTGDFPMCCVLIPQRLVSFPLRGAIKA